MKNTIRDFLGKLSLFIFILTAAIALTILAIPIYQFALTYLNIPERVGMSFDQIMDNYYAVLEYLHFPWVDTLVLPDFPVSASGAFHFWEVKILFYINYGLLLISAIGTFFYLRRLKRTNGWWRLVQPFKIAIFVPFVLLLVLAIDFDFMFVVFHEILFNNDAWIFSVATDPIITVLPQEFFMYCFIFAFVLIEAAFIGGYFWSKNKAGY
jgi:integral membrane protein (TIGR01906 family)